MILAPVKCKNTQPYVERPLVGEFTWLVYNTRSGHIVAATYDETMAKTLLHGIKNNPMTYYDEYAIAEMYKD